MRIKREAVIAQNIESALYRVYCLGDPGASEDQEHRAPHACRPGGPEGGGEGGASTWEE